MSLNEDENFKKTTETNKSAQLKTLFWGGIAPVILFTILEEKFGTVYGLIAGMIYGVGEVLFEYYRYKKVSRITLISNAMIIILGFISLWTNEGYWFKLQPAILEFVFFSVLFGSWVIKKPFLKTMSEAQGTEMPEVVKENLSGMTLRISFFFLIHSILAYYAALHWSTESWALLKGVGLTVSFIVYLVVEVFILKYRTRHHIKK